MKNLILGAGLAILVFSSAGVDQAIASNSIEGARQTVFSLGTDFAQAETPERAKKILKAAVKTIQKTRTNLGRLEDWMVENKSFGTMMVEGYTVAVAISASEVFFNSPSSGYGAHEFIMTVFATAALVVGAYLPLRWGINHAESQKNEALFQEFLRGVRSLRPELPTDPEEQISWIRAVVGHSKWLSVCETILVS